MLAALAARASWRRGLLRGGAPSTSGSMPGHREVCPAPPSAASVSIPARLQQLPLAPGDVGDEAEVVVGEAALVADGAPAADSAVLDRLGVGVASRRRELGEEAVADAAEVGGELGEAEGVLLAVAEDDVDALGLGALGGGQQLAVEAELEDEVGLGAAGELGVGDLVAVVAEVGGARRRGRGSRRGRAARRAGRSPGRSPRRRRASPPRSRRRPPPGRRASRPPGGISTTSRPSAFSDSR